MSFEDHIKGGVTTLARCWAVIRRDGVTYGFTDHDLPLTFDGIDFKADAGMTARAIVAGTGMSVDNSEAMGALTDAAITEADIEAGRFDGAEVKAWLVNWQDVTERSLRFAGEIGELRRVGGAFHAEMRGLTERLNQPQGRVYLPDGPIAVEEGATGAYPGSEDYFAEVEVEEIEEGRRFRFADFRTFDPAWFERGRLEVLTGAAAGLVAVVKRDRFVGNTREIEVWEAFRTEIAPGDLIRIEAGYDGSFETCRLKYNNAVNFQGFPDIPGEDWLVRAPQQSTGQGGSLRGRS
ncbi:MAG: DUF2163 domain-containing protein [Pseudomonadota bacterium]